MSAAGQGARWWLAPEWLFAFFATVGGLILIALIPPLAGGNEQLNFQRVAGVVSGEYLVGPVAMPGGVADLLDITDKRFPEGAKPPYHYLRADFSRLSALTLRADQPKLVQPSPIAVLHPISYVPQLAAVSAAEAVGARPLVLFYAGRLAGLLAALLLTFAAIRVIPAHKHGLAAIALLPPILFSRATLDADQMTNGLAFLFIALLYREIVADEPIRGARIAMLAAAAFVLAQAKSAYLLLPFLALAIPTARFASRRDRLLACALIVVPGILASVAWMLAIKLSYFDAARYRTWSGVVDPHAQFALVVAHPLEFALTLLRTIFATPFIPRVIMEFLGVFGPPVALPMPFYPALAIMLVAAILSGTGSTVLPTRSMRPLSLAIAAATILIVLTLLYLQWTAYGLHVVEGFRGSYLYPLAPLVLLAVPAAGRPVLGLRGEGWLLALGLTSLCGTLWLTWQTYLA